MAKDYQDRIEQLIYSANEQINSLVESEEDVIELLNFKDKFYKYSLRNMTLINKQFKGAVAVGTFQFWKENGFHVNRGEKGIEMLVPVSVQSFKDSDGKVKSVKYATKEEKEKIERGEINVYSVTRFKIGHVFDVSQTNAKASDLPKLFPNRWIDGEVPNYEQFYKSLEKVGESVGSIVVNTGRELGASKGATYVFTKEIELNHRNSELQNVKTFIHELAHAKLHTGINRGQYTKSEKEFQAELVAYAVCSHFNLDVSEYSLNYLKTWTKDTDIPTRTKLLEEVYNTAKDFIKILEENMAIEKELNKNQEIENEKINLRDCGVLLRHFALESINTDQEMYFCEIEDFEDLIDEGLITKENWEEFEQDLKKFRLLEEGYLELHTDFESFENDRDKIDCVMTGYMEFWKQFEYDQLVNSRFPNEDFRKIIVERLLDRHDGTTDIFKSDLEVLKNIEVLNLEKHKLTNIKGIEHFESLRKLDVSNNPIINLDVSDLVGLQELYAYGCQIHNLNLPKSETLEILDVTLNNLEDLDLEKQSVLKSLSCNSNQLSELVVSDCPCLEELLCSDNFISDLDLTNNKVLKNLECENNEELTSIYIHDISKLENYNVDVELHSEISENMNHLFPDENFRKAILENVFDQPTDDPNRNLYQEQLDVIKAHQVLLIPNSHIHDLTGIEQFTSLYHLDVSLNPIQSLKGVSESCRKIYAHSTHLEELNHEDIPKGIKTLDVSFNSLETLDVSNCEELKFLFCSFNELEDLNITGCDQLYYLTCQDNMLRDLQVQDLESLEQLDCKNNFLSHLELPDTISWLCCDTNRLEELKLNHCSDLEHLECAYNNLEVLEIQELENLKHIDCRGNCVSPHELINGITKTNENEQGNERSY